MELEELSGLLQPGQKMIVLYRDGGQWRTSATGSDWDFSNGTARLALIQEVDRSRQAAIVMDAQKDERFLNMPPAPFRSALCCPVQTIGLLLVEDRNSPRAFTFEQLQSWAVRANQLAESLRPPPAPARDLTKPLGFVGLAVALFGLPMVLGGPAPGLKSQSKVPVISRQQASAATVAESYLAGLRSGNLNGSYRLLSTPLQEKLSEPRFIRQIQSWLAASDRAWGLKYRQIKVVRAGPSQCRVEVVPLGQASRQEPWIWDLVKEEDGWRLNSPPGGFES